MKRLWIILALFAIGMTAWIISGCSSKSTNDATLPALDTATATLLDNNVSQPMIEQTGQDAITTVELAAMIPAATIPRPSKVFASSAGNHVVWDTVAHSYGSGWHVFYFSLHRIDTLYRDTHMVVGEYQVTGYDSIRLWYGGQPVQYRSMADSLESRLNAEGTATNSDNDTATGARHRVIRLAGNPWASPITTLTINGISHDTLSGTFHPGQIARCTFSNAYVGQITNLVLDSATLYGDGCPPSGAIGFSAHVTAGCSGLADTASVNGTWSVSVTYNNGIETKSFSNGLAQAVASDTCGTGPAASPFRLH